VPEVSISRSTSRPYEQHAQDLAHHFSGDRAPVHRLGEQKRAGGDGSDGEGTGSVHQGRVPDGGEDQEAEGAENVVVTHQRRDGERVGGGDEAGNAGGTHAATIQLVAKGSDRGNRKGDLDRELEIQHRNGPGQKDQGAGENETGAKLEHGVSLKVSEPERLSHRLRFCVKGGNPAISRAN
jgi:hypothetical protein